ncbi:MAG: type I secretion system permease/ATPase [Dinoroseobacter sp.]|nr:type I secretion system permease/ATPase [Dinoroseobacter sp.]
MSTMEVPRRNWSRSDDETSFSKAHTAGLVRSVIFFGVFVNVLMLTGPLFMLQVYDRVLGSGSQETLVALFALVAGLYALYGVLDYARGRVMARVGVRYFDHLAKRVFTAAIQRDALGTKTGCRHGALGDLEAVRNALSAPGFLALFDLPWTPFFLMAIFVFHPLLGWAALAGGCLLILTTIANQYLTRASQKAAQNEIRAASHFASQSESGADLIHAQGMTQNMAQRWMARQSNAMLKSLSAQDKTGGFTSFAKAFRLFLQSAMLALGAYLVLRGELTGGAMVATSILLGRALAPIEQSLATWAVMQRGFSGKTALRDFLRAEPEHSITTELPAPKAHVSVSGLTVLADPGRPALLRSVSFEIAPGQALGVIGKSGSGKSTLARSVVGLVTPTGGEIRLDGAKLDQYSGEAIGRSIGYLPQDVVLFEGTVAENIAHMTEAPDAAKVVAAAKKARIHDTILKLPKGYDTQLSAGDPCLSGGQKQRIALARALYGNPQLLVLDEPNSALDSDGCDALNAVVAETKQAGGSVIIMTHRPSAISVCDRLLVLENGAMVSHGDRDDVLNSKVRNADNIHRIEKGANQ